MRVLLVHGRPEPELVRLLAREGHDVLTVGEHERPVRFLGVFKPDLVLIATHDPVAICSAVRGAAPGVSILVLQPIQDLDLRIAALEAGADDCLGTQFHRQELFARMRATRRSRKLRAHESAQAQQKRLATS